VTLRLRLLRARPRHGSVLNLVMHHDAPVMMVMHHDALMLRIPALVLPLIIMMTPMRVMMPMRALEAGPAPLRGFIRLALLVVLKAEAVVVPWRPRVIPSARGPPPTQRRDDGGGRQLLLLLIDRGAVAARKGVRWVGRIVGRNRSRISGSGGSRAVAGRRSVGCREGQGRCVGVCGPVCGTVGSSVGASVGPIA
jgi:hypothetical protein